LAAKERKELKEKSDIHATAFFSGFGLLPSLLSANFLI
jgi:hypothetical protein